VSGAAARTLLVAHPSPDVYGSDLQLLETIAGAVDKGWQVIVFLPSDGPLVPLLVEHGATVEIDDFPVLRKALLTPRNLLRLLGGAPAAVLRARRLIRARDADAVYVNTLTIPLWILASRLAGRRVLCHVHEAEDDQSRIIGVALALPLMLAKAIVANSETARRVLISNLPWLRSRIRVIYNGMSGPASIPTTVPDTSPTRIALVGRLSPRKGIDVALDAVGLLVARGYDVSIEVCGTAYAGYEWYEQQLRARTERPDLVGRAALRGYTDPVWPVLAQATMVVVPSRHEPFGNTAVEGLLAGRPVVASHVQGLSEIIDSGRTGLLVPPGDPEQLAAAMARLIDDPQLAQRLADVGRADALTRFSRERYRAEVVDTVEKVAGPARRATSAGTSEPAR
jgi:glycosyltransferase involved in cell wall biosynthesis